jgi:hypothetical protein
MGEERNDTQAERYQFCVLILVIVLCSLFSFFLFNKLSLFTTRLETRILVLAESD